MADGGTYLRLKKQSAGFTPPPGYVNLYVDDDAHLHSVDEEGTDRDINGQVGQQGEPGEPGAGGGVGVQYATFAAFRASSDELEDGDQVWLAGNHTAGLGEGWFTWRASSTKDDDNGTVLQRGAEATGRLERNGAAFEYWDTRWFGAIGDAEHHFLDDFFANLAAAQVVFPHAVDIAVDEIDWAARLQAMRARQRARTAGHIVHGGGIGIGSGLFYENRTIAPESGEIFYSLSIRGCGGQGNPGSSFYGGPCWIIYTGDDDRWHDFRSATFMRVDDINFWYDNEDFDGKLFDCTWMPGVNADASHNRWVNCTMAGDPGVFGAGQGAILIDLHLSITSVVEKCAFGQSDISINLRRFPIGGQPYSNAITIRDCSFQYYRVGVANAGDQCNVLDCTFEGLGGFTEAGVADECQYTSAHAPCIFTVNAAAQTITRSSGSWIDDGFEVGDTPFFHDRLNRVNGPNNMDLEPISALTATVMTCPGSGLVDQTNTWGSMSKSGAFTQATAGVELVFDATAKTITRDEGSWLDDGWLVNDSQISIAGTADNDGTYGPITALTDTVMTIASATFVDETSTNALLHVMTASGPMVFARNWCGDQFLPGSAWLRLRQPVGTLSLFNNSFAGATRVLELLSGGSLLNIQSNTMSSLIRPIYVDPRGPGWSNAIIMGNGSSFPILDAAGQAISRNLLMICNSPGDDDAFDLSVVRAAIRGLTTIGGDIDPATLATSSTYALLVTQGGAGSVGLGGDADGPLLRFFGNGRINPGDTYTGIGITTVPTSVLETSGAIATPVTTFTTDGNISYTHSVVLLNGAGGNVNRALPTAVGCKGRRYVVKRIDGSVNTVKVSTTGGQTIDGAADYTFAAQYDAIVVVSDNANWLIESERA